MPRRALDPRTAPDGRASLRAAGLRYSTDARPGISRRRARRGFTYRRADDEIVRDRTVLARIRALAIPPAWTSVWICPDPAGHIQATGRDARQRKQYRYHARWRARRDDVKFERLLDFARVLPRIRERCDADLARPGLSREKVITRDDLQRAADGAGITLTAAARNVQRSSEKVADSPPPKGASELAPWSSDRRV